MVSKLDILTCLVFLVPFVEGGVAVGNSRIFKLVPIYSSVVPIHSRHVREAYDPDILDDTSSYPMDGFGSGGWEGYNTEDKWNSKAIDEWRKKVDDEWKSKIPAQLKDKPSDEVDEQTYDRWMNRPYFGWMIKPNIDRDRDGNTAGSVEFEKDFGNYVFHAGASEVFFGPLTGGPFFDMGATFRY